MGAEKRGLSEGWGDVMGIQDDDGVSRQEGWMTMEKQGSTEEEWMGWESGSRVEYERKEE